MFLVLIVCAPLAALTIHQFSDERRRQSQEWGRQAVRLAEAASEEEAKFLRDTRQLLFSLGTFPGLEAGDQESVKRFLEEELHGRPQYSNLGFLDAKGNLIVSAVGMPRTNFANQSFFRRAMATQDFSGGRLSVRYQGRKATVDFGFPVFASGSPARVAFASVNLKWLDRHESPLRSLLEYSQAVWTEVDPGGTVVSRHPAPEAFVGRAFPRPELLKQAGGARQGLVHWEDQNGNRMTSAFASRASALTGGPVTGILTVPSTILFEATNRHLQRNMMWLATATGLTLLLGWVGSQLLVVKPIKTLARASARLAAGDMSARTGLKHGNDELGALTLAFDQMAEALEHREQERLKSARKLQVLSHRLVEVQENERRHIARELHDEIGQSLTAAEMNLQAALQAPRSANIERRLAASMQAVEQVLEQVHDLSLNLRPSMLDDLGLDPALRWLTRRQAELAGVDFKFDADPLERRLDPVIETECFRIAQEALTNIVRHAKARNIFVSISVMDGRLHLKVRDDGQGFDVAQLRGDAVRGASLGLLSMEERAALAGGGISINSCPGRGTEVHAWFPLRWENDRLQDEIEPNKGKLAV